MGYSCGIFMTCGSNTDYFVILRTHGTNFYRKIKQIILAGQYASGGIKYTLTINLQFLRTFIVYNNVPPTNTPKNIPKCEKKEMIVTLHSVT